MASSVFALPCLAGPWSRDIGPASLCTVVDGDTLECDGSRVRLRGLFAPEGTTPTAALYRGRLLKILTSGVPQLVTRARDRHGRVVADLYVDGVRIRQADIGPRAGIGARYATPEDKPVPSGLNQRPKKFDPRPNNKYRAQRCNPEVGDPPSWCPKQPRVPRTRWA